MGNAGAFPLQFGKLLNDDPVSQVVDLLIRGIARQLLGQIVIALKAVQVILRPLSSAFSVRGGLI
jgi:hypothetical protein